MVPTADNHNWCERLYEREASRLLLYGRALGLSHNEAEDVLHDTFRALLSLAERPEEPRAYLVRSFRNRALNHHRGFWRRLSRELESQRWFEPATDAGDLEGQAMRVLESLPVPQREVVVLKIWHGLTFEAIGCMLDESPHTVAGRYRYGLQKLRTALKGTNHAEPESHGTAVPFLETTQPLAGG
jgi:RNA polymerase sigma-70 factor (ECF subfamily)